MAETDFWLPHICSHMCTCTLSHACTTTYTQAHTHTRMPTVAHWCWAHVGSEWWQRCQWLSPEPSLLHCPQICQLLYLTLRQNSWNPFLLSPPRCSKILICQVCVSCVWSFMNLCKAEWKIQQVPHTRCSQDGGWVSNHDSVLEGQGLWECPSALSWVGWLSLLEQHLRFCCNIPANASLFIYWGYCFKLCVVYVCLCEYRSCEWGTHRSLKRRFGALEL